MKKQAGAIIALCGLISAATFAQGLSPSTQKPVADGIINSGEYSRVSSGAGMKLSLSLSADGKTLYAALEAPTSGWVAIGIGSTRMDGAFMVLAFDASGSMTISEQTGSGHSHKPNSAKKLSAGFVKESAGITVLEFALPAVEFVKGTSLKMLMAYGQKDNLNSFHSAYFPVEVPVK